jgi:hypothetical protein
MKPLRDAIRREAGRVWREKAQAEGLGLFVNEESITETMLLNLATTFQGSGLFVRPFSKAQEKRNGADWELWFIQGANAVGLRVQAKRLFPSGKYDSLKPTGSQIATLIKRAGKCFPVYVFYNDPSTYRHLLPICACGGYRAPSYRGCTLSPAARVALAANNSASSIQAISVPWHCMFCDDAAKRIAMPEAIAQTMNGRFGLVGDQKCEFIPTPRQFSPFTDGLVQRSPTSVISGDYHEPEWLEGYLSEKMLAGTVVVSMVT